MKNFFWIIALLPLTAFSQEVGLSFPHPPGSTMFEFVKQVLGIVIKIGIPAVVIYLVVAGFLFASSLGSDQQLGDAKKKFVKALIVTAVLLGLLILATIVRNFFFELGWLGNY